MAFILSIETSSDVCSVALHKNGLLISNQLHKIDKSHSSLLPPIAIEVCKEANVTLKELEAIAVSEGPGSYTGLRIGVSTAKGFAYTLGIPVITVPTIDIMLEAVRGKFQGKYLLCAMMDARRMEVYAKMEDQDEKEIWPLQAMILSQDSFVDLKETIYLFGNGMPKFREIVTQENLIFIDEIYPDAVNMGNIAHGKYQAKIFEDVAYFEPNYLKEWQTTTPKKKLI
ncbi:MAG: tRNA (adenosine(37)-N6)-threonylcarbamoyltransferase complex dimerization subunit type 1 TsaB [Bacteroidota bacterium]